MFELLVIIEAYLPYHLFCIYRKTVYSETVFIFYVFELSVNINLVTSLNFGCGNDCQIYVGEQPFLGLPNATLEHPWTFFSFTMLSKDFYS